jgi:hypothetical protein
MATPSEAKIRSIAGKASSLYPVWVSQAEKDGSTGTFDPGEYPALGAGVSVEDAVHAIVRLHVRDDMRFRKMEVSVGASNISGTQYRVIMFGTTYSYTGGGGDDVEDVITGLHTAIAAGSDPVDTYKSSTLLTIEGDYKDPSNRAGLLNSPSVAIAAGSGTISKVVEATEVTWQLLTRSKNLPSAKDAWCLYQFPNGDTEHEIENFSYEERIQVAGLKEIALVITSANGTVTPMVGVCAESD